jgi:hypothetical protein
MEQPMSNRRSPAAPASRKPRRTAIAEALATPASNEAPAADGLPVAAPDAPVALVVAAAPPTSSATKGATPADVGAASGTAGEEATKSKHKLVRDSFTIPKNEYTVLTDLKQRAARLGNPVKKSEILRAGIRALAAMPDDALLKALTAIPVLKTGRPKVKRGDAR